MDKARGSQALVTLDMDAVDRELAARGLTNPNRFARASRVDPALCYKVLRRQRPPTNGFIVGLVSVGIDLDAVKVHVPGETRPA
jgi:hypothetical protein